MEQTETDALEAQDTETAVEDELEGGAAEPDATGDAALAGESDPNEIEATDEDATDTEASESEEDEVEGEVDDEDDD